VNLYIDTSTLLKLYLEEASSDETYRLVASADLVATSIVSYAESRAGLARALRTARLSPAEYRAAVERFTRDWQTIRDVGVDFGLVQLAGRLAETHALRGFDAIQLASALVLRDNLSESLTFSSADTNLLQAAAAHALDLP
jgi:predicted nucleic acid-binding protein